ncbi:MAG: DUF3408 domain-containing protein [Clostridiales bacterium]|jgi:predicted DNA-binding protein|nr:DUF3408 domain-containing protein [Clostridiales bacterium]
MHVKKSIGISLDTDVITNIKKLAKKDSRPLSQYINLVLRKHLEEYADELDNI